MNHQAQQHAGIGAAEDRFREAVQREQSELMAVGIERVQVGWVPLVSTLSLCSTLYQDASVEDVDDFHF